MEIQKITTEIDRRIETGPLQVNDDWPGVFIRGDNALHYAAQLQHLLDMIDVKDSEMILSSEMITKAVITGLLCDLQSCNMDNFREKSND